MKSFVKTDDPIFVVGDFNEPHLDWTEAAAQAATTHESGIPHPLRMAEAFTDSYRIHPNEVLAHSLRSPVHEPNIPIILDAALTMCTKGGCRGDLRKDCGGRQGAWDIVVSPYPSDHRPVVAAFTYRNFKIKTIMQTP